MENAEAQAEAEAHLEAEAKDEAPCGGADLEDETESSTIPGSIWLPEDAGDNSSPLQASSSSDVSTGKSAGKVSKASTVTGLRKGSKRCPRQCRGCRMWF